MKQTGFCAEFPAEQTVPFIGPGQAHRIEAKQFDFDERHTEGEKVMCPIQMHHVQLVVPGRAGAVAIFH